MGGTFKEALVDWWSQADSGQCVLNTVVTGLSVDFHSLPSSILFSPSYKFLSYSICSYLALLIDLARQQARIAPSTCKLPQSDVLKSKSHVK